MGPYVLNGEGLQVLLYLHARREPWTCVKHPDMWCMGTSGDQAESHKMQSERKDLYSMKKASNI